MIMFKAKSTTAFTSVKNKVAAALKAPVMPPPMKRANLSAVSKQTTYPRGILVKPTQPAVSRLPVDFGRRVVASCSGYSRGASGSTWGTESYYSSCLVSAAGPADDCGSPLPMPPLMTDHVYESDPPSPAPISVVPFPRRTGVWDGDSLSRGTSHSCCCSSCCPLSASSSVDSADGRGDYISPPPPFMSLNVSASQTSPRAPQTSQSPSPSLSVSPCSTATPTPAPRRPKLVNRPAAQKVRGPVLAIHQMRGCEYFGIVNDAEEQWMADDPVIRNLHDAEASVSNSSSQLDSSELTSESAVDNITKLRMEEMLGARPGGDASYQGLSNTLGVPELNELELQWLLVNMRDFVMSPRAMEWYAFFSFLVGPALIYC
ncbi:hypothetical protein CC1G_10087 [Coprinopsis cinerea okayama7|uniref:Uncharacterized protein n=1 Tax=Coprinopsis cinerea (strain Okayama-7 / 130 / ATCC MYA-4618 / FGSC 9003) TaxID=240176 RepID=A8NDU7_COPC7|nr:hypothetical protein CC1G_10087 [Coprinopsis cinerea okayama7\|eukprot:XP_001832868.2 hypothetical protein CC1G_10087 [Coprinopsis cinerea okayama7\